jgi:ribosomal-protein-alanine N-acetyltransferase
MIKELSSELNRINELENSFSNVLKDVNKDLANNPFSHYLLYIENDKVIGFLNYYLMYEKIEIANFNVLDNYQNKGIGTKLIKYLIDNYKNIENITLEVRKDNIPALKLYKEFNFKEVAIRKGYYNGIDGILMERKKDS